jgi:hypothetical protein
MPREAQPDSDQGGLARHVERAGVKVAAMQTDLRWQTGLAEDGTWLRQIVGPWEADPTREGDNAFRDRALASDETQAERNPDARR